MSGELTYQQKKQCLMDSLKGNLSAVRLAKETSNLFRWRTKNNYKKIDVRNFDQVIHIDADKLVAEVEGMMTFDDLVKATLEFGCLPAVVPELKTITIGGALVGIGIESSSFRYGLVHETITNCEVLLATGEVIECNATNKHQDLFKAFPNSYGTLGYALKVSVKLVRVRPFVKLTHHGFSQSDLYYQTLKEMCETNHSNGSVSYIDGSIFSKNKMVITTAEEVESAPYLSDYTFMQCYYKSIQDKTADYLSIADYIWRWDTDWFWCSKAFGLNHALMRRLFGKKRLNSKTYSQLMRFSQNNRLIKNVISICTQPTESVIQDVMLPIDKAADFLRFFHQEVGIVPVWNCPVISYSAHADYSFFNYPANQLYINFGFWDTLPIRENPCHYNRLIEQVVMKMHGYKSLYSSSFYSKEEFWSLYDESLYVQLKQKYDPDYLLGDLYNKCSSQDNCES